jgi:hypothetical protein
MLLLIDTRAKGFRIAPRGGHARLNHAAVLLWRQRNLLVGRGQPGSAAILGLLGGVKIRAGCGVCYENKCLLDICLRTDVRWLRERIAMNTDADIYRRPIGFH